MNVPARVVSGLTASAKALFVAGAAHSMPHGVVLYVVPGDGDLDQAVGDVCLFLSALEGLSAIAADRAVLAFPSHEIDPYRGLAPHVGVTSTRARALHALAGSHGSRHCRFRGSAPPARQRAGCVCSMRPSTFGRDRKSPLRIWVNCWSMPDSAGKIPRTSTASSLSAAGSSTCTPRARLSPSGSNTSATRSNRCAGTTLPLSDRFRQSIRSRSFHCATSCRSVPGKSRRRTSVILRVLSTPSIDRPRFFDYLTRAKESQIFLSESDEVEAHLVKLSEQIQHSYEEAVGRAGVASPAELFVDWSDLQARIAHATNLTQLGLDDDAPSAQGSEEGVTPSAEAWTTPPPLSALPALHVRCQPSVEMHGRVADWVAEIRRLRGESEATLFVAATPGRAERTIELLKEYDLLAVPVERAEDARYAAVLVAVGHLSRGFRLPDAGLQIYAEADVFEEERRAPERRRSASKAFLSDLRDLKIGDLVVHVDHGIGMFVGLKQIGVADSARSFSSSATPATTSCSCRSNGWI